MQLYVELWNANSKWLALSEEDRQQYIDGVGPSMNVLIDAGVEIVGWAMSDTDTPHDSGYRYIAVWKMPSAKEVDLLEKALVQAGWHDYFDQVNARGELIPPPQALEDMVKL